MTERLSDISARIDGIRQLGSVVNAMRGIAAARVRQARGQLVAVDSYSATIALAIGRTLALVPTAGSGPEGRSTRSALVLFCAEQGFAGSFSERVLDAVRADLSGSELFLVGTRGRAVASERGIAAAWNSPMPSQSLGLPKLADRISEALYSRIATGEIGRLGARSPAASWTARSRSTMRSRRRRPRPKGSSPRLPAVLTSLWFRISRPATCWRSSSSTSRKLTSQASYSARAYRSF